MSELFVTPFEFDSELFDDLKVLVERPAYQAVEKLVKARIEREREEHYRRGWKAACEQKNEHEYVVEITRKDAGELYQLASVAAVKGEEMMIRSERGEIGACHSQEEQDMLTSRWRLCRDIGAEWMKKLEAISNG